MPDTAVNGNVKPSNTDKTRQGDRELSLNKGQPLTVWSAFERHRLSKRHLSISDRLNSSSKPRHLGKKRLCKGLSFV
jgi:hypothetical protein